jgi:hypothetical protein
MGKVNARFNGIDVAKENGSKVSEGLLNAYCCA